MVLAKEKLNGNALREEMIQAAEQLFYQHGYTKTSVQDIATAAGVTKGSFYYYFQGKEDLLFLIHDDYISHVLATAQGIESSPDSALQKLDKIMYDIIKGMGQGVRPNANVFLHEIKHLQPEHKLITKEKRTEYHRLVSRIIEQGMNSGEFRQDLDPKMVTFALLGMCIWTCQWMRPDGARRPEEIAATFAKLFLDGLVKNEEG
jgi:AcrR family transcriptional regulator